MKNKSLIVTCVTAIVALTFSVLMLLLTPKPDFAPRTDEFDVNNPVAAMSVEEIGEFARIKYANYVADEFVQPSKIYETEQLPKGELVDLTKHQTTSNKGSYQFLITYPEITDEIMRGEYTGKLHDYLDYDGKFHVTVYIPPIYSASVVYVDGEIAAKTGDIAGYDFADYDAYIDPEKSAVSDRHESTTRGIYLDLAFESGSNGFMPQIACSWLVTIHFEGNDGLYAGLRGIPLIGTYNRVNSSLNVHRLFTIIIAVAAAITIATFTVLCFLKHTVNYLPQLFVAVGILFACWTRASMVAINFAPYLWGCIGFAGLAFISLGTALSMRLKIGKFPIWIPVASVAGVNCLLYALLPLLPAATNPAIHIYRVVMGIVLCAVLLAMTVILAIKHNDRPYNTTIPVLGAVLTAITPFVQTYELLLPTSPITYLFAAAILFTMILGLKEFVHTEKRARYLETNLLNEVQRRTQNLNNIVEERDRLLRYISHDIKKPVASINRFANELITNETEETKKSQLQVIANKAAAIDKNLAELQKYAKLNFSPEQPQQYDIYYLLEKTYDELHFDCEASDIILHRNYIHLRAYFRKNTLAHVLENLIFNCIEHANCRNVYLSVQKINNSCQISVTDDGVGIEDADRMFSAYASSEDNAENLGLGLYICRELVRDMGGDLEYARENEQTVFTIKLPLA